MRRMLFLSCVLLLTFMPTGLTHGTSPPVQVGKTGPVSFQSNGDASTEILRASVGLSRLQVPFIENVGQVGNERVRFLARVQGGTVFITDQEITYAFLTDVSRAKPDDTAGKGWVLTERLVGARETRAEGIKPSPAKVSYHIGRDAAKWRSGIPTYEEVSIGEVYEGVRLSLGARGKRLEKIFVLDSRGKPDEILLRLDGAKGLEVNASGELEIETEIGTFRMSAPVAYQEIDGKRIQVAAAYRTNSNESSYGFTVGDYDRSQPLVIDPSLIASTFIGGSNGDSATAMAFAGDGSGDIYIAGYAVSMDYPTTAGSYKPTGNNWGIDAFVSRLSGDLTTLVASTFLGGTGDPWGGYGDDYIYALIVDGQGDVLIGGMTNATDFPVTPGAFETVYHGGYNSEAFVSKLDSGLSSLIASTFINKGGVIGGHNAISALALDSSENIYIAGTSNGGGAPVAGGYDETGNGSLDAFVAVMSADLTSMSAFTYLGGNSQDKDVRMVIDPSDGTVLVTGTTASTDFPVTPGAYDTTKDTSTGLYDGFIARFNPGLKKLLAATYIGGDQVVGGDYGNDHPTVIALTPSGDILIAGTTSAPDYPTTIGAYDITHNGGGDGFVSKLNRSLTKLIASTFIGHSGGEGIGSLALDPSGAVFVCGTTNSYYFPVTIDAYSMTPHGSTEVFVSKFDADLSRLFYSTFIGGSDSDEGNALLIDQNGDFIVLAQSWSYDWPTTEGAYDTTFNGTCDAVVARLSIPDLLWVEMWGTKRIFQGEEGVFVVSYKSTMKQVAEDVVVVVDVPPVLPFISTTGGGIYYNDTEGRNHIYWKLGDLNPQDKGELSFKISIPWGFPKVQIELYARIGATNFPDTLFEIQKFLDHVPAEAVSSRVLSDSEIVTKLATNKELRDTFNYAVEIGYLFFNVATSSMLSDGNELLMFHLMSSKDSAQTLLINLSGKTIGFVPRDDSYTLFDESGGFTVDTNQNTFETWGTGSWAPPAQASFADPNEEEDDGLFSNSGTPEQRSLYLRCVNNCTIIRGIVTIIKKSIPVLSTGEFCESCFLCDESMKKYRETGDIKWIDDVNCRKCTLTLAGKVLPLPPLVKLFIDFGKSAITCEEICTKDPTQYTCEEGDTKKFCCLNGFGWESICGVECQAFGVWSGQKLFDWSWPWELKVCKDGEFRDKYEKPASNKVASLDVGGGRDPNAKLADMKGEIVAGKRINYTIQYENTGTGTAYQVFVLDKLPVGLDDTTLKINNGGKYLKPVRTLYWIVGDVGPGQKGEVTFSVAVKKDAADGTEIVNWAEVHFPSADEITPTNPVVNVVRTLAANPQVLEGTAGAPLKIVLSGQGPTDRAYKLMSAPLNGSLKGTPPIVTYTPNINFSGMDSFTFAVTSGEEQSNPAEIQIKVNPSPLDTIAPKVVRVYPADGATGVSFGTEEVAPGAYSPSIQATFSEQIDPATLNGSTFTVSGLAGTVSYDASSQKAVFAPSIPLSPGQGYTVALQNGIKDMAGNPLAEPFSWSFTTAGTASLAVTLPGELDYLSFGEVSVKKSKAQGISISNRGSGTLDIGSIKITGTAAAQFALGNDACSGKSLGPQEACSLQVTFGPVAAGTKSVVLEVPSNDPLTPVLKITMRGTGVVGNPDLTGSWKSLAQTCEGGKCRIQGVFIERNKGGRKAGPSLTRFYLFDASSAGAMDMDRLHKEAPLKEVALSMLKAKNSKSISLRVNLQGSASGKYVIGVVDATNAVAEGNEKNNFIVFGPIP